MEEENHFNPLTKGYSKSDDEFTTNRRLTPPSSHSSKCLVYILVAVVLLSIVFLVFGLVVLRVTAPSLKLSNVAVQDLRYQTPSLNLTLIAGIRLHNMNFGRFKFHGGTTTLLYRNATIGRANIHQGRVGGRERTEIDATVTVVAGGPENNMNISGLGLVKLRSLAEVRGEVRVVKIVNRHRTAVMNCTMDLNLTSQAIQGLSCQ